MAELFSTGEVSTLLGVSFCRLDGALRAGHGGPVSFAAGRRLLTPENLRALARHFDKPLPREALSDLDPADLEQEASGD